MLPFALDKSLIGLGAVWVPAYHDWALQSEPRLHAALSSRGAKHDIAVTLP